MIGWLHYTLIILSAYDGATSPIAIADTLCSGFTLASPMRTVPDAYAIPED